ncbi:MAG: DUF3667 domain-containing protein [Variovorax sp.]
MNPPDPLPDAQPESLPALPPAPACANCGAMLSGEFCSACGQRHEPHMQPLSHFVAEAVEGVTHADSRLWRTLAYLLARPGMLTREFLAGRRARYMPPFRLYLVISVVFFLVGIPAHVTVKPQSTGEALDSATLLKQADNPATGAESAPHDVRISFGGLDLICKSMQQPAQSAGWFRRSVQQRCERLTSGDGSVLGEVFIHNVPRAMFVFLPLLALVMKALYWRRGRYYVEHLLFLIHNHAFVFLAGTLLIVVSRVPFMDPAMPWVWTATVAYAMWYFFRAMRSVYGQPRGLSLAKYLVLGASYLVAFVFMMLVTVIYSALTL